MVYWTAETFLERFVLPLVAGGDLRVSAPISESDLTNFVRELPHQSSLCEQIDDARANVVSVLVVKTPPMILGSDELYLAAALHNVLLVSHPHFDRWSVTDATREKVLASARGYAARSRHRDKRTVLARHGLLSKVLSVKREDVRVTWWTGSARFQGQRPPERLRRWKGVRRVREEHSVADCAELFSGPDTFQVISSLLRRSPLTQVLCHYPITQDLHWEELTFLLRDVELCRALCYSALDGNLAEKAARIARFSAAFDNMLARSPSGEDVRSVAAFLLHLNALMCEEEVNMSKTNWPFLSSIFAENESQRLEGAHTFAALPSALAQLDGKAWTPPGIVDDSALFKRWELQKKQIAHRIGSDFIDELCAVLQARMC